ncbi:MAG: hypothetical protein H6672_07145 [Anaerolineaceae bacterium]|nr:hypothetical protein [Anaerolineaceae bacterium]
MMPTIRLLTKWEIKRIRHEAVYWLRLLGLERDTSRLYRVYVVVFWAYWVFAVWAFLVEQVYQASQQFPPDDALPLLTTFRFVIALFQIGYTVAVLVDTPLKLTAPDLAYVATAPISRGAITLVRFVRRLFLPAGVLAILGTLAVMFFTWNVQPAHVGIAGLMALFLTFLLVYLSGALSWMIGIYRQSCQSALARRACWLALPLLLVGFGLLPGVFLWPADAWVGVVTGTTGLADFGLLGATLVITFGALFITGNQVRMAQVIDDSQLYARIQRMGALGPMIAADVIARIYKQARLTRKKWLWLRLPATPSPTLALSSRAALSLARLSPQAGLRLVITGMALPSMIIAIITFGGYRALQTWVLVFLVLQLPVFRPSDATRFFREPLNQPFLRQFLPANHVLLFISQTTLPLALMSIGMVIALALQPQLDFVAGWMLAVETLVIMTLCEALENVRVTLLRGSLRVVTLRYEFTVIFFGVWLVLAGALTRSLWGAALAGVGVMLFLFYLLHHSE